MIRIAILVAACLVVSLLCSVLEGALYAIAPSRVEALRRKGGRSARVLAGLRERIDEPMAAILTLNTVAQTFAAVAVGDYFARRGEGSVGVAAAAAVLTLVLLFVTELIPKSLGVTYADAIAPRAAIALQWLVRLLWPVVRVSLFITSRLKPREAASAPTAEDVLALTVSGARAGNLDVREVRWIANALRLSEVTVKQILTPRTVVYGLPAELPLAQVKAHSEHWVHSRLPIFR
ncbi:MAG TPA: CNNM domain-containing protein, partial [Planctomycetota bacterium]|nr:CNNM domain-containing protein [Planctomycetota bacterium]